jgi:hypothetical protein
MASGSSETVEHSTCHPEVNGSIPAIFIGKERERERERENTLIWLICIIYICFLYCDLIEF